MATTSPTPSARREGPLDLVWFLLKWVVFLILVRTLVVSPFTIPSESMLPRLVIGDYLFVTKWNYGWSRWSFELPLPAAWDARAATDPALAPAEPGARRLLPHLPERGDVVVFRAPPANNQDYIKRVIGLPGDRVRLKAGRVILNGEPLPRQRVADLILPESPNTRCLADRFREVAPGGRSVCRYPRYRETMAGGRSYEVLDTTRSPQDDYAEITVPPGRLFLMGDNRDYSADSRFPPVPGQGIGLVPADNLLGRAALLFFSTDGSAEWWKPWTWVSAARTDRIGGGF